MELGCEKFSSNVIEKCMEHTTKDVKLAMVKEVMSGSKFFYQFLNDQYGNYVI